ncbi:MAG: hypothetical protein K6V36_07230 [Anaerolineae bacterium]|nr:hypothetical protein [Anaerolineae bacterium]
MRPKVRMIAQAHLDPVWLWRWTEGRAEALATSRSAVDRLHEYPSFHFVRGEAQVYEWIEEEAPELFAEIKALIRAGRWHVVNGMIVQPDMNLPQGESFVRQALLAKRYFQEKLGVDVRIAYCVDSFGHAGTLPQILNKCGFDGYVFMRPQEHEKALPHHAFWWQAPDGSRVLAYHIADSYTGPGNEARLDRTLDTLPPQLGDAMLFFGVGNHGGGPTRAQIEEVLELSRERQDVEIRFDHPQAYFDAIAPLADRLPVVADELQYHATGCYSVNSALKRAHRQAECALLVAERMVCLAELWTGRVPERERLRALWHDLCFNQFHDTLAGSSIKEAEDEAIMAFGRVILSAREIADSAGRLIGSRVDTSGPGSTVLLFNPFPYRRQEYVEYEPWTDWQRWHAFGWELQDEAGRPVPCQVIEGQAAVGNDRHGIDRLVFRADLPPLGYRLYRFLRRGEGEPREAPPTQPGPVSAREDGLENDLIALRLDRATGAIVSCLDKASGLELVGPGGWNVAQVLEDTSDTWSHGVRAFDRVLGCFGNARITVGDHGPLQASLYVERSWEESRWLQQLVLRAGEREVLVRNWLLWQGRWRMVKLAFDVAVMAPVGYRDVPFGAFRCPDDGAEIPLQMWLDVSGRCRGASPAAGEPAEAGLAVLNDGKYAGDVCGSTLRLTVLRCPPYAYHVPHVFGTRQRYDWVDQGLQEFTLVLMPHLGNWRAAGVVRRARELNLPVLPITMYAHAGTLPPVASAATLIGEELELTALKPAEDGDGYILRLADRHGYGGTGRLIWMGEAFELAGKPFEVITLRLTRRDGRWQAALCDMIERPAGR